MKHTILCVDDEVDNIDALERLFRRKYKVLKTTSPLEALDLLKKNPVTVIISDQRMPNLTGVELLAKSIEYHPDAIRILLTGYTDIDSVVAAINSGQIYRYVTKPWDPVDLTNAIDKAVERYELGAELVDKNKALQKAYEELQTLDQAKSHFMILVNHELKTPLTAMLSFSELLSETTLDGDQKRMLTRIQGAARRLQEMINDALEYVSAETAQTKVDFSKVMSDKIFAASSISDEILKIAQERRINFKFAVSSVELNCDEKLIRNVFRRLLHNAAKFAQSDTDVVISGDRVQGNFQLRIANYGPPIDEKQIALLLKPFTLNENVLNHSVGTGLGLSVCQAVLKLHKSALVFTSIADRIEVGFDL
jgi:two-component system, sensor histidine kinase and response regulator